VPDTSDTPGGDSSAQLPSNQTYWRPEWSPALEANSETDPTLLKLLEAHISWREAQGSLGNLLIKFQFLETTIKEAIAFLLNSDDLTIGRIATARMQFRQLLKVLYALVSYQSKNQATLKALGDILKKCDNCCDRRNEVVHSLWYQDRDEGVVVRFEIRVSRGTQPYDESEEVVATKVLELDAKECEIAQRELHLFMIEQFPLYELSYRDIPEKGE